MLLPMETSLGGLDLAVGALQLLAGQSLLGEAMLDPALHDRQRGALPLEPAAELLHERRW